MRIIIFKIFILILLVYTPRVLAQESATQSAVNERIESVLNKPKAYIGSITDLTELNLNISGYNFYSEASGEIKQVMINEEDTEFFEDAATIRSIDFEDVAIGDFVIAMGYETREGILEARQILVTSVPDEPREANYFATISEVGVDELTLSLPENENIYLAFDEDDVDIFTKDEEGLDTPADLTDITETTNVIVFTEIVDEEETVASIFIIPTLTSSTPETTIEP